MRITNEVSEGQERRKPLTLGNNRSEILFTKENEIRLFLV